MQRNDELIIHINTDGKVFVEDVENGVKKVKTVEPDVFINCIRDSIRTGAVSSGILPSGSFHFAVGDRDCKKLCMQHKEVINLSLKDLVPYEAQPFHVIDDEAMTELAESIKIVGVLVPIIVRQIKNNKYEIISGHRRKRACEIAGVTEIPATIMELDDDEAAIMLVDCNLQRENLLPSEKAYAYKLKLDAIKHQGKREILDADDELLLISSEIIGKDADKSGRQIRRYIRLTELILDLLDTIIRPEVISF